MQLVNSTPDVQFAVHQCWECTHCLQASNSCSLLMVLLLSNLHFPLQPHLVDQCSGAVPGTALSHILSICDGMGNLHFLHYLTQPLLSFNALIFTGTTSKAATLHRDVTLVAMHVRELCWTKHHCLGHHKSQKGRSNRYEQRNECHRAVGSSRTVYGTER